MEGYRNKLCFAFVVLTAFTTTLASDVTPVPTIDLQRYLGTWHEIARLPMFFQRNCKSDVTAEYTAREDGRVGVHNSCKDASGNATNANGVAVIPDPNAPAKLKVTFVPDWLSSWLPFVWGNYWVIALDDDYQWAMVGEPGRRWLWILSRNPTLDQVIFDDLKAKAVEMGYDLAKLIVSGIIQ